MTRWRWIGWVAAALALCVLAGWLAGLAVERRETARLIAATTADARLRQGLLGSEIARFRLLPLAMADDRDLRAAVAGIPGAARALDTKLETLSARTGAAVIYVIGPDGRAIAASNWRARTSFVGRDYRFRRYYRDALRDGAGEQFALGTVSRKPGLYLTRRSDGGGVIVVKLDFDDVERQWRAAGGITFATNAAGIVLVTSRADWRFSATAPLSAAVAAAARADSGTRALAGPRFSMAGDGRVAIPGRRGTLLHAVTAPDATGWRVHLLVPARPIDIVTRAARIAAALATLGLLALGWGLRERARRRSARTATLEAAVAARTADLSREIDERTAAEARAAELREGLRQANRLATLGQITAGLAHETAQPVAAIRTYAANAAQFLDRGAHDAVHDNLRAIGRLTERIGAITAELRGFARKRSGEIEPVPLGDVIDGARLILKERLARVTFVAPPIDPALRVVAGRVRLEQVLVNLLQNAIEALDGHPDPRIALVVAHDDDEVRVTVEDNGPGIAADIADRLFTPFATSRPNGLGLGLVIAQDIMADLGGSLRLLPGEGGARFRIVLRRAA
ncbi:ATP-binding protein [Sphingomonas solaris]|nr:ATP-binding protein [Sphingomonas solaris]